MLPCFVYASVITVKSMQKFNWNALTAEQALSQRRFFFRYSLQGVHLIRNLTALKIYRFRTEDADTTSLRIMPQWEDRATWVRDRGSPLVKRLVHTGETTFCDEVACSIDASMERFF